MFKNKRSFSLRKVAVVAFVTLMSSAGMIAQSDVIDVDSFTKVVVSPHIQVVFVEGDKESVTVESITEPLEKFNVEVKNNTLSVFLEDARVTTKSEKKKKNGYNMSTPIYKGTVVRAVITYKSLQSLDLRGEERFEFKSPINTEELRFAIYGESQVYVDDVALEKLYVYIYGESYFEIKNGKTTLQKITSYGESTVNVQEVDNEQTKLTAYGDGSFRLNVSEKIKVTAYGEATVSYSGGATLSKGIVIGESTITKI